MPNTSIVKSVVGFGVIMLFAVTTTAGENADDIDFNPFGSFDPNMIFVSEGVQDQSPIIPEIELGGDEIAVAFKIISDATGWSIFPTAEVSRAKVSLWAKNITAMELLESIVTLSGFIYHKEGDIIGVMTYDEYLQHYGLGKKVLNLTYADAGSVLTVIKSFFTKLGKGVVHPETNTIVLFEAEANLELLADVIEQLDTSAEDITIEVINLKYADCTNLANILKGIFGGPDKNAKNKPSGVAEVAQPASTPKTNEGNTAPKNGSADITAPYEQVGIYAVSHANQLVVVGSQSDIRKIKDLVVKIDVYGDNMVLEVIDLEYADAQALSQTLMQVFSERQTREDPLGIKKEVRAPGHSEERITMPGGTGESMLLSPDSQVGVYAIGRTNQIIIKAFRGDVDKLKTLVEKLDTYVEPTTQNYHFVYVDAAEIFNGLEQILGLSSRYGGYRGTDRTNKPVTNVRGGLTLVEKTNSILLTGPPATHRIMTTICETIDVPGTYETGTIRIYKIENADVEEIAQTVRDLLEGRDEQETKSGEPKFQQSPPEAPTQGAPDMAQTEEFVPRIQAKVSVNKATNSVVVQATMRQHLELEKLIKELDKRRKQVLIEAMIISVATKDNLELGVELGYIEGDTFSFTSFGLSTIDPATGDRELIVGPGGTAAVLPPDDLQAILRAVESNSDVKIMSVPRVLVNDNGIGTISSVEEAATTQTNLGNTATTTSFSGYVEAGTQFAITPHISETDYLRVEYVITLNAFSAEPTDPSAPPPRTTTSIQAEATIPDGHTIVVGGLQSSNESESVTKVPLLGDIPIIKWAFRNTIKKKQLTTTYLFVTTTIMRDEGFDDLKDISKEALSKVERRDADNEELESETANAE
ncbi:MAG: secretin N-terminal domain-containing protein [Planctomycetota bacterium]|jgi:type II secretory pathway component GspD/PulD (secretin)